jgi:hypothetical protein
MYKAFLSFKNENFSRVRILEVTIKSVNFTALSLRSLEAQSTQRIFFLFLFAERAKRNKFKSLGQEKLYIICRRHAGFHLPEAGHYF